MAAIAVAAIFAQNGSGRNVQVVFTRDNYTCYRVDQVGPTTKVYVLLRTQFDQAPVSALTVRTLTLCAPTGLGQGRIADPAGHLDCRQIAVPGSFAARDVMVTNAFGSMQRRVFAPWSLCAPALTSTTDRFPAPPAVRPDHFECYTARYELGIFPERDVTITNQFEESRTVRVRKATQLCAPVEKTIGRVVTPIRHPAVHLVCYELMPRLHAAGPFRVYTNSQLGVHQLVVNQRDTLCLPSTKRLL